MAELINFIFNSIGDLVELCEAYWIFGIPFLFSILNFALSHLKPKDLDGTPNNKRL